MTLFWSSSVNFLQVVLGEKMVVLTLKAPLEAVRDDDLTFSIKLPNIGLPNQMVTLAPFPLGVK